jgi:hypothetical protein
MVIHDKLGILFPISREEKCESIETIIDNYLENLIINNNYIISINLIHRNIWNEINNSNINKVQNIFKDKFNIYFLSLIKKKRKEIKISIKKGNFDICQLNIFIKNLIKTIYNYKNCFELIDVKKKLDEKEKNYGDSIFFDIGIKHLCSLIICDPIISSVISRCLNDLDKNNLNELKKLFSYIKKFSDYNYNQLLENKNKNKTLVEWFYDFLNNILFENINIIKYNVDKKFCRIYKFSDLCHYKEILKNKLYFIKDNRIFNGINTRIKTSFSELINLKNYDNNINTIDFIICFFKYYNRNIKNCILNISPDIIYDIVCMFDKFKSISNNNQYIFNKIISTSNIFYKLNINLCSDVLDNKLTEYFNNENNIYYYVNTLNKFIINSENKFFTKTNSDLDIFSKDHDLFTTILLIKDKDIFVKVYTKSVILRLMNNYGDCDIIKNMKIEKLCLGIINCYIKKKFTYKLERVLKDFISSISLLDDYYELLFQNASQPVLKRENFRCIITSYNNWSINITDGFTRKMGNIYTDSEKKLKELVFNNGLCRALARYGVYYNKKYLDTRDIYFLLHLGKVEMIFNSNYKKITLSLLPIQSLILFHFINKDNSIKILLRNHIINYVLEISSYSNKIINSAINSLVKTNLIVKSFNKFLTINMNYNNDLDNIDICKIFYQLSNIKIVEDCDLDELCHDREDILISVLNSIIKKYPNKDLFELKELIKMDLFPVSDELIKKCLDMMIKDDYIVIDNGKYRKLIY